MSETDKTNSRSYTDIPVILAFHQKEKPIFPTQLGVDNSKIFVVHSDDGTAPEFFNSVQKQYKIKESLYGYFGPNDHIYSEKTIHCVIEVLLSHHFGAAYCDFYLETSTKDTFKKSRSLLMHNTVPMFSHDTLMNSPVIRPLFIISSVISTWDVKYKSAFFYDKFKELGHQTLLNQIPKPLIKSSVITIDTNEIQDISKKWVTQQETSQE